MKIEIKKYDGMGAFGAFCVGSVKDGSPIILIDLEMIFKDGELIDENDNLVILSNEEKKRALIESLMHEFGHALEEKLDTEFNENWIERVVESYHAN